jgi:hypothetical protein
MAVKKRIFLDLEEERPAKKLALECEEEVCSTLRGSAFHATEAHVDTTASRSTVMESEAFLVYVLSNMLSCYNLPEGPGMYTHAVLGAMYHKIFHAGALHVLVDPTVVVSMIGNLEGNDLEVVLFVLHLLTDKDVDQLDVAELPRHLLVFLKVVLNLVRSKRVKRARIKAMVHVFFLHSL